MRRRHGLWLALGLAAGCVGTDPGVGSAPSEDAGPDAADSGGSLEAGNEVDGGADAEPPCDLNKPFPPPVPVTNVNSNQDDQDARLSGDGTTMLLASNRNVAGSMGFDLYIATRTPGQAFTTPVRIPKAGGGAVGGAGDQTGPSMSPSATTLYFATNETGPLRIHVSTRANDQAAFGDPGVWSVSTGPNDRDPYAVGNDVVYFASDRTGGALRVFRVIRANGVWGSPQEQMAFGSQGIALQGVVTPDELTIFFMGRPDSVGSFDIYTARRQNKTAPFPSPTRVDELSDTSSADAPSYISADGCTIYFSSNRPGGLGMQEIWSATRPK